MRTIDADVLKEIIEYQQTINPKLSVYDVIKLVDNAPTVDFTFEETFQKTICENRMYCPARPTGEWINIKNRKGWLHLTCSCCSYNDVKCTISDIPKFCPNCGAKMKGEKE